MRRFAILWSIWLLGSAWAQTDPDPNKKRTEFHSGDPQMDLENLVDLTEKYGAQNPSAAISSGRQALELLRSNSDTGLEFRVLLVLGEARTQLAEYRKAEAYIAKSKRLTSNSQNQKWQAALAQTQARLYGARGNHTQAMELYSQAMTIWEKQGDLRAMAQVRRSMGWIYHKRGRYQKALALFSKAKELAERIEDRELMARCLYNSGVSYRKLGDTNQSLSSYYQALEVLEEDDHSPQRVTILRGIGIVFRFLGEYVKALDYFNQALVLLDGRENLSQRANIFHSMGLVYRTRGEFGPALEAYLESLRVREKIGAKPGIATELNHLGVLYSFFGEHQFAKSFLIRSLTISESLGDAARQASTLQNLGTVYRYLEEYDHALDCQFRSLALRRQVDLKPKIANSLNAIGIIYKTMGEYENALDHYLQAYEIRRRLKSKVAMADLLNNMGETYEAMALFDAAHDHFCQALELWQETGHTEKITNVTLDLAVLLKKKGRYATAITLAEQAQIQALAGGDKRLLLSAYWEIADIYRLADQPLKAFEYRDRFQELNNQMNRGKLNHKIAMLRVHFDLEQGEKEIQLLKGENELQKQKAVMQSLRAKQQQYTIYIMVAGLLILLIAGIRIYRHLRRGKRIAEREAKSKSEFLALMSHELRTPMNGVLGSVSLLDQTELSPEQQHLLQVIDASGKNLLSIINDILDLSKIEAGKMKLHKTPLHLRTCLEDCLDFFQRTASDKNLDLEYRLDPFIPKHIYIDSSRLRQVLRNLLSNAIKFTERGAIHVEVQQIRRSGQEVDLQFSVHDTGIGISEDKLKRLFEPFYQVDPSQTREYEGTGLGLALSRRLCRLMNGETWAESIADQGSTFYFTLRTKYPPDERSESPLESAVQKRVLLAALDPFRAESLAEECRGWAMSVTTEPSIERVLSLLQRDSAFDVALLEHAPDKIEGLALADAIRERGIPVILLVSGNVETSYLTKRASACLQVPPKRELLKQKIRQHSQNQILKSAAPKHPSINRPLASRYPLKILVVEDNFVNLMILEKMLNRLGYLPDRAQNGLEALAAMENENYDLCFMDLQMPRMDGLEASRRITQQKSRQPAPVIIAITANVVDDVRGQCQAAGMRGFLAKPIHFKTVASTVDHWGKTLAGRNRNDSPVYTLPFETGNSAK